MPPAEREPAKPLDLSGPQPVRGQRLVFPGWAAVLGLAAAVAIAVLHAWQQRWLCDDAFISFRYSRQLVDGYGLVFNRGEWVEGYTNFLWVLEMALGMLLGVGPEVSSVGLGGLASLLLAALLVVVMVTSPLSRSWWPAIAGLLLLALNRSVAVWTTSGLETRQFTLFCCAAVVLTGAALRARKQSNEQAVGWKRARFELLASLALTLAEATRPEGGLVFVCVAGAYLLLGPLCGELLKYGRSRQEGQSAMPALPRETWVRFAALVLPFVVFVGAHYLFRRAYYGDWLPNTYYAKHVRPWPESGDEFFTAAILEHGVYLLLPLAVVGAIARFLRGDALHLVSFAVLIPHAIYIRRIGGDHFEYRPLDLYWPLLTIAAIDGLLALAGSSKVRRVAAGVAFLVLAEYSTVLQRAYEHEVSALTTRATTYKLRGHLTTASAPEIPWLVPNFVLKNYNIASIYCVEHQSCTRQGEHKAYWKLLEGEYGRYRTLSTEEARVLPADATWAREAVGVAPYMFPGVTVIDQYGLTDRTIARTAIDTPNELRTMAHDRRPPPGYLRSRGVNIEVGPASRTQGEALRYAYWAVRVRDDLWIPFSAHSGEWVVDRFEGKPLFSQFAYDSERVLENVGWIEGRYSRAVQFLGRFDSAERDGWIAAEEDSPEPRATLPNDLGHIGAGYLSTLHPSHGDRAKMRFTSPPFAPRGHLVFLLAGGGKPGVEVRLVIDGGIVKTWSGRGIRAFEIQSDDLRAFAGSNARLELIDDSAEVSVALDQVMLVEADPDR